MMTPQQLKDYCFGTSIKGYSITEVDDFLEEVSESYEKLYKDNAEMQKKIDFLLEKIEGYREDEDSLKSAILGAQRMADSVSKDAKKKADRILRDAEMEREKIIGACKHTVDAERFEYNRLRKEINEFRERLIVTYKSHLEQIKDLPAFEDESEYPETMEEAKRLAGVLDEPVVDLPEEPEVTPEPEPEAIPEPVAVAAPEPVAEPEPALDLLAGTDTVEFRRQPAPTPVMSKGVVGEDDEEDYAGGELRFGPDYDLEEEEEKPRSKRRSIFGKHRDDEE